VTEQLADVPLDFSSIFGGSWQEKDGATVTKMHNHDKGLLHRAEGIGRMQ